MLSLILQKTRELHKRREKWYIIHDEKIPYIIWEENDNQEIAAKRKAWKNVTDEFNKKPGHLVPVSIVSINVANRQHKPLVSSFASY